MNAQTYYRPALATHRTEIEVLRSRFITSVARATTTDAARAFLAEVRDEMPDASHHVYAFRIGYGNSVIEGMSDDGEPSGTSGPPTLAVVRGSDIGDIVLVTTRYFGGTKLGTGGLVRAYTEAAQTALDKLSTTLKAPRVKIGMDVPYTLFEQVKRLCHAHDAHIDDEIFAAETTLLVTILIENLPEFQNEITELSSNSIEVLVLEMLDD